MKNFRPNKKGFTLVEEVVSVLLVGILIVSTTGILMSTMRIFIRNVLSLNSQERGIAVMNQLEEHIKYASEISSANDITSPYSVTLSMKETDGKYTLESDSSFKQFSDSADTTDIHNVLCNLGTYEPEYTIEKKSNDTIEINVKIYCHGDVYYSDRRTVKLMNENADISKLTSAVSQSDNLYIGSIE